MRILIRVLIGYVRILLGPCLGFGVCLRGVHWLFFVFFSVVSLLLVMFGGLCFPFVSIMFLNKSFSHVFFWMDILQGNIIKVFILSTSTYLSFLGGSDLHLQFLWPARRIEFHHVLN